MRILIATTQRHPTTKPGSLRAFSQTAGANGFIDRSRSRVFCALLLLTHASLGSTAGAQVVGPTDAPAGVQAPSAVAGNGQRDAASCKDRTLRLPQHERLLRIQRRPDIPTVAGDLVCDALRVYRTAEGRQELHGLFLLNPEQTGPLDFRSDYHFHEVSPQDGVVVLVKAKALRFYFIRENRLSEIVGPPECIGEDARSENLEEIRVLQEGRYVFARATSCKPFLVDTEHTPDRFPFLQQLGPYAVFEAEEGSPTSALFVVDVANSAAHRVEQHRDKDRSASLAFFLNARGLKAHRAGGYEEAIEWFSAAVEVTPPDYLFPHTNLAAALTLAGQTDVALDQLRRACEQDAEFARSRMLKDADYDTLREREAFQVILDGPCSERP